MRFFFAILFLLYFKVNAATYYVSVSGVDANPGTKLQPFRTYLKAISVAVPYDSILGNRGDIWIEQIKLLVDHLYFGAYGTGAFPHITGLDNLSGLSNIGNIWSGIAVNSVANQNTVIVNGQIRAKSRTPNTGYLTAVSYTSSQVVIPHTTNNYVGSELVALPAPWVIDVTKVIQHKTGVTNDTLVSDNRNGGSAASLYFLQNKPLFSDTANEWSSDSATKVISVNAPSQPVIQYSIFDTLVDFSQRSNVVFENMRFSGGNNVTIFGGSRWDTLKNCTVDNSGGIAIYANPARGLAIINDTIQNSLNDGYWIGNDTALYVYRNFIYKSALFEGMGGNGPLHYNGGFSYSNGGGGAIIQENIFKMSGYHGVRFVGINTLVYRNWADSFCLIKTDGGGIYTYTGLGNASLDLGSVIRENITTNGIGTSYGSYYVQGIYLDDGVESILVDGNTVYNVGGNGIQTTGRNHVITNNMSIGAKFANYWTNTTNLTFKNNLLFTDQSTVPLFVFQADNFTSALDSNYYLKFINQNTTLQTNGVNKSLSAWKTYYNSYDAHSSISLPTGATSNTPVFYSNPSSSLKTITVSGGYSDVRGMQYENTIELLPYQSVLLFPSTYKKPTILNNVHFKF